MKHRLGAVRGILLNHQVSDDKAGTRQNPELNR